MRRVAAAVVCLAGLGVGTARAVNPPVISRPIDNPLPTTAGALHATTKPGAALTVTVTRFPLRCGHPIGIVKIVLPKTAHLPRRIDGASVRLNGATALRVTIAGHTVSVTAPLPTGITCHSIIAGPLTLAFNRTAGVSLTPPRKRTVPVRHGAHHYRGVLRLSS